MNLLTLEKGQPRFTMMDENMWGMILGRSGRLPGKVDEELVKLAALKGKEFTDADPQSYYPDALPQYEEMMKKEGWDEGPDREELFELAMHESQYRDYRSGLAKRRFEEDLEKARQAKGAQGLSDEQITLKRREQADPIVAQESGRILWEVQAADEAVKALEPYIGQTFKDGDVFCTIETSNGRLLSVPADMGGRIVEICAKQGDTVRRGDVIAYIRR